jgi:hypothetical protein
MLAQLGDPRRGTGVAVRRPWSPALLSIGDVLGGNWGDSGVHVWVNSGKDG